MYFDVPEFSSYAFCFLFAKCYREILKWLVHCLCDLWQSAGNSSALFLTAAAQNLLCIKLAEELGLIVSNPWVTWFKAASLPALVCLLATPLILYKLYPPEIKDTPDAPALAAKKLESMGPVTQNEWIMVSTMLLAVSLWIFGYVIHLLLYLHLCICMNGFLIDLLICWHFGWSTWSHGGAENI